MNKLEEGSGLTIGRLAKAAQVGIETIRYYQRLALLPIPTVTGATAFRHYPVELVERIKFIKRAQDLGFSLQDISDLLLLHEEIDRKKVRAIAGARLETVRSKIADLRRIESTLAQLIKECEHAGTSTSCPIIAAFSGEGDGRQIGVMKST